MKRHKGNINPTNNKFEVPFVHGGREYTLMKRDQAMNAPWYLRIRFRGKEYLRSSNTNDADLAISKAKKIVHAILHGDSRFLQETKLRDPVKYATLGPQRALPAPENQPLPENQKVPSTVFDLYRAQAPVARGTVNGNINALCNMLRVVFGEDTDTEKVSVLQLTPAFVRAFQNKSVETVKAQKLAAAAERTALARAQRTANSLWNQARSLFIPAMMLKYRDAGLVFPADFDALANTAKISGVERTRYMQPPDKLIHSTIAALRGMMAKVEAAVAVGNPPKPECGKRTDLKKETAPEPNLDLQDRMAVVLALAIGCGFRPGEMKAARVGWIGRVNDEWSVTLPKEVTKNELPRRLRLPTEFQPYILRFIERRKLKPEDLLIPNSGCVTRATSRWMRDLGWTGTKTNHALRKYYGYLIAKTYGMEVAQWALDHADISTTQNSYAGLIKADDVVATLPIVAVG